MKVRYFHAIICNLVCISALLITVNSFAQEKRFGSITTADGLPQNSVDVIVEDSTGFIWIGTQDGLARYDGYRMLVYRNQPKTESSLSDNFITSMLVDAENGLWVGTRNGVNYFDRTSNTFKRFLPDQTKLHQAVYQLSETEKGVKANINGTLYFFDPFQFNEELTPVDTFRLSDLGYSFQEQINGQLKVSLKKDSVLEVEQTSNISDFELTGFWPNTHNTPAKVLHQKGHLWFMANGIWHIDLKTKQVDTLNTTLSKNVRYLNTIQLVGDELWIATDLGLWIANAFDFGAPIQTYTHDPSNPFSISYDYVHDIFQDKQGLVWVGTANKGLNYFDPQWQNLNYIYRSDRKDQLPHPLVWCAQKDSKNNLWVGTAEGLASFKILGSNTNEWGKQLLPKELAEIESVRDILFDDSGNLMWIASGKVGLLQWNVSTQKLTNYSSQFGISTEMVDLEFDDFGKLWAGAYFGMYVVDTKKQTVQRIDTLYHSSYTLDVSKIGTQVFVSHSRGIAVFNQKEPNKVQYKIEAERTDSKKLPFSIASSVVSCQGKTWVGLYDIGLVGLNDQFEVDTILTEAEGLVGHVIEALLIDDQDNLWISTNQGVSVLEAENNKLMSISESQGLRSPEFALGAAYKDQDGVLYFGSVDGLLILDPKQVLTKEKERRERSVRLTNLQVNYTDYREVNAGFSKQPLSEIDKIELYADQRVISFEFSALDFKNAGGVSYSYQLVDFDEEEVRVNSNQRFATYSNLPSGSYTFVVRAHYSNGDSAAKDFVLPVVVHPPFYEEGWFRAIVLLALVLLIAGFVRYFTYMKYQQTLTELKTKERLLQERERISRDLHDSVGSQLTYVIGSLDNMAYQAKNPVESETIDQLSNFARGTMQQLREVIWVINKEAILLEELRLKLEDHCIKMLQNTSLAHTVSLVGNPSQVIEATVALHIFRICQEAINNVLKHSEASQIKIDLQSNDDNGVLLIISDNGVGFDVENRKKGHYGLDNINDRVTEMNGEIEWKSAAGKGTEITIKLN